MKRLSLRKAFLTLLICLGFSQLATAATQTSGFGTSNGLGLGITPHDTDLLSASSVGATSSFLYSDLTINYGSGINPNEWVFGTKSFSLSTLSIGTDQVVDSIFLEISSGGHGLNAPSSLSLNNTFLANLSDGDGVGPRNPGNLPSPTYNALFLDRFDITSFIGNPVVGSLLVTIAPGGGSFDGWALDYARLVYTLSDVVTPPVVVPPTTTPVPLPAAFWLFAAGLLSLFRFKKKNLT